MFESSMSTRWSRPRNFSHATILSPLPPSSIGCGFIKPSMGGLEKTIAPTTIQPTHAIPFPHPPIRGSVQLWQPMLLSSLENWPLLALCGDYSRLDTCPVDVKTVHSFSVLHALEFCSTLLILCSNWKTCLVVGLYTCINCLWWQISSFKAAHLAIYSFIYSVLTDWERSSKYELRVC